MKRLWGLLVVVFIAVALVISAGQGFRAVDWAQAAGPAMEMPTGMEFVNKSPAFSVIYPQSCKAKRLEIPTEVLRVISVMSLPAFVCEVLDAPKGATLQTWPQLRLEGLQKDSRYVSKSGWKLNPQKETQLADGTPAVEFEIGWDYAPGLRFYTLSLATIKNGKIIDYSVTTTDEDDKTYKKYLYSLKLQ